MSFKMEISSDKFKKSVKTLLNLVETNDKVLHEFLRLPDITAPDILKLLNYLGSQLLDPHYTENIGIAFQDCILLIVTSKINNEDDATGNFELYQKKCIALSKLMSISSDILRYATKYFTNKPAPFQPANDENSIKKKAKLTQSQSVTDLEVSKCCYQLLSCDPVFFKDLWNWSQFVSHYLNQGCDLQKLYCNHAIAIITHMTPHQLKELNKSISEEVVLLFHKEQKAIPFKSNQTINDNNDGGDSEKPTDSLINVPFTSEVVTNVEGVFLPIFNNENKKFYEETDGNYDTIVRVDSTKVNLRSIALGVSSGKAVCLSGPVGCGKTTLVEYLARKTGRICPKQLEIETLTNQKENKRSSKTTKGKNVTSKKDQVNGSKRKSDIKNEDNLNVTDESFDKSNGFLRIQLGDQTDSKMLLGQYRCTDVPGEFIWLPGVLTQAVMNGYWLLLEDLDSATQDTYTILNNLLENNFLSVPGFRDCVKIEPGFQLFVTIRTNKGANASQKCLYSLLEKYLYTINVLPLSRNELCRVVSTNYPKLSTVANRIVDVFLTFSSGDHTVADNLRTQESDDKADTTEKYVALPFEAVSLNNISNSGRLVSTRDLIKLCGRSNPMFSVTSTECAYFVFQNAVDVFCSYLPEGREKTRLVTSIGAKLGIIQSRCEFFADEYKPEVQVDSKRIKVGRAELVSKSCGFLKPRSHHNVDDDDDDFLRPVKKQKLEKNTEKIIMPQKTTKSATFSFTRMASCLLERISVCVGQDEPVLLVGETGVGKTSSVQYLAEKTHHKLVVVNMNNQSDVSDLVGGFKPVDINYVVAPLRSEFENLFRKTFDGSKNETFLNKFSICYNQGNFEVLIKLMITVVNSVFSRYQKGEFKFEEDLPKWKQLQIKLQKLDSQLTKSINISFAFIPGSLVNCIKNGDWVLLDEINLASAETLECLSTILEPDGSVVLLEKGDFTPVKRHPDFRIFACMNPNTDIGKKDLPVGIRNRFTEFFVDELTTDGDLTLLVSDYLSSTGIEKKRVTNIVKMYKKLRILSKLELNDGLGNRPVFSLRTLCRSLRICAKNLCGSIERNLYESFCMSFLTQLDPTSHNIVLELIKGSLLSNVKAILSQGIPRPGEDYLNFEGYWIQKGPKEIQDCNNYILTKSVGENLKDLSRIISIGKLPILLQGPTSAGKTSLIEYVAKKSGNHCLRINNHEHTDLQEYIGTYTSDVGGKLSFKEGVLVQAMRNGFWIILDELNLASTDILEALNRVLDDNRELFIPETQTVVKAHPNFMLFATQNPPGLYGGRKTLSRAFKNRFIELHFSEIPRNELEVILEKRCLIPQSYSKKMVQCMWDLQKNRKTTTKNVFTLRDLFRWGNRYTFADKQLLEDLKYDWNQHLIEEGYLVLSAKVRTDIEIEIIEETLYRNFRKKINLDLLFGKEASPVTRSIIDSINSYTERNDIVWTRNMTRMAVLAAKAIQFDEPVLLVGPTGCGKTTVCQILASIHDVNLRILNCHMHTEGADFLGGLRPCRTNSEGDGSPKLFEWADGPLIMSMVEGSYFMADEISLAEDSVLERLNCILEPERTVLLAEKGGVSDVDSVSRDFVIKAAEGFQFFATMNPGGDFGKKELSPALRNRFTEIWCIPSDSRYDLVNIAANCMSQSMTGVEIEHVRKIASFLVDVVFYIRDKVEKFKFSIRDVLAWSNYLIVNSTLEFPEAAVFGLETIFLDSLEMLPHESIEKVEQLKLNIIKYAIEQAKVIVGVEVKEEDIISKRGVTIESTEESFGIKPFFIATNPARKISADKHFLFDAPTTKKNLFRLLSALSLNKPVLLEGPPGVGKTSIVESLAHAIGYNVVRINLCEHTDLADLFGTDLPAEENIDDDNDVKNTIGSFVWRDGPLLAALKSENTWILLDELNLAPQSVLEGLNAILDHRGEVFIPELNKTFILSRKTRIFACQNPLRQGGGRKGLPQSFLNRFNKVYLRKLSTDDLLFVVNGKYAKHFEEFATHFNGYLQQIDGVPNPINLFDLLKQRECLKISPETHPASIEFDLSLRLVKFSEKLDKGISDMEFGYKGGPFEINLRDILRWCDLLISPETGFILKKTPFQRQESIKELLSGFENFLVVLYERMKLIYYQRMRSDQDKIFIRNAFSEIFNCDAEKLNALSEDVSLYWTDTKVYLNDIVLEREPAANSTAVLRPLKSKIKTPLLLSSQRESLKNLIECVYMEKPVLLCGPTDSGKTKLIDLMCTLSNEVCNMDTIDDSVTGSFQQIDLNRHLEEISQSVETIFITEVQNLILETKYTPGNKEHRSLSIHKLEELLNTWSKYADLNKIKIDLHKQTEMSDELNNFRNRIQLIAKVIIKLLSISSISIEVKSQLEHLNKVLKALKNLVRNYESLNTGGSFEWVDSKIVKSLKNGQYISLEHVNLCSSAILDRLNPVFEPNGKLLISEKGVTANDEAEIVDKHENFRAFLTIDPKNGELSRAMRNRCVEIAFSKDNYTQDDLRVIVYESGIRDMNSINTILKIHELICGATEINSFNVSHLTQFAFLVEAYKRIGYDDEKAIYVSGMEVYVYSSNTDLMGYGLAYYQNQLREIVLEESKKLNESSASINGGVDLQNVVLRGEDLNSVALVKMQAEPFRLLLKNNGDSLSQLFSSFDNLEYEKGLDLIRTCMYMLYETSSMEDSNLRHLYLNEILQSPDLDKASLKELQMLNDEFYFTINQSRNNFGGNLSSLPWNSKLFPRIREYIAEINPEYEQQGFALSALLLSHLFVNKVAPEVVTKLSQINALAYSQAVQTKVINDRLNNVFLNNLSIFVNSMGHILNASLRYASFNLSSYVQAITAFLWANRMLEISKGKLFIGKVVNTNLMDKLLLHFKWLDKNLLKLLDKLLPNYKQLNAEFDMSLQKIANYALSVNHPLNLIRKIFTKQITQFQPFYSEEQVQKLILRNKLDVSLAIVPVYGSYTNDLIAKKLLAQKSDVARKLKAAILKKGGLDIECHRLPGGSRSPRDIPKPLLDAMTKFINDYAEKPEEEVIDDWEFEEVEKSLVAITSLLNADLELPQLPNQVEFEMMPLREYFLNRFVSQIMINKSRSTELNELFIENISSLSTSSLELLQLIKSKKYQQLEGLFSEILKYIVSIETESEFESLIQYLSVNFKLISTHNHLVTKAVHSLLLNNLSSRSDACLNLEKKDLQVASTYSYNGPPLSEGILKMLFHWDGSFKAISLTDLQIWKSSLADMRQLIWNNGLLMTKRFDLSQSILEDGLAKAKKLCLEVEYVQKLCQNMENENFSDYNDNFQKLVSKLKQQCLKTQTEVNAAQLQPMSRAHNNFYNASLIQSLVGAIELCLLTFTPLIDPVEKNRLKNEYIVEDINCLTTLMTAYDFMKITMNYKNFGSEICNALQTRLADLSKRQAKFSQKVALRPDVCLYSNLVQDITHFLKTNCEPNALHSLLQLVDDSWQDCVDFKPTSDESKLLRLNETYKKIDLWISNSQRFINHTMKRYIGHYEDFLQPLECSVGLVRFGFEGLKVSLQQLQSSIVPNSVGIFSNLNEHGKLANLLTNIVEFPSASSLQVFNVDRSKVVHENRSIVFSVLDKLDGSEFEYFRLLKSKILELKNRITISSDINEETFNELDFALNICNKVWQDEEERKRKQKAEEDSLYVTKTKCETEDEELIEMQEIEENFPTNVQEDFGEFIVDDSLEKVMKLSSDKKITNKSSLVIRDEDYGFLAQNFIYLMEQFSKVYYYHPETGLKNKPILDFISPFKDRVKVFVRLFSKYKTALNDHLDGSIYNTFAFAIGLQQEMLNEVSFSSTNSQDYNFYKDSNIPEIISCTYVLDKIETRVVNQLELYPEHASLIDIVRVIKKIRGLPSTSPVVRFNTGFQILRQKVAQWNEVAHKNNHLRDLEIEVAEFVQKWTKLELQFWRTCLSQTHERVQSNAYKYYFFIYNLLQEYIQDHEIDSSYTDMKYTEKRFAEGEAMETEQQKTTKISPDDILRILRQFVESSSYGDFQVRMDLLKSFELYLHYIQIGNEEKKTTLIAGLHNLQIYFSQFSSEIEENKKSIRAPIEKKLKEFVKIESYNKDLSYFSMRSNVARVHRSLNKFLKEYQNQLTQKITPVFQPKDATVKDYSFEKEKGRELRYDPKIKYYMVDVKTFVAPQKLKDKFEVDAAGSDEASLLYKVGKLFLTSRNVVKETISNVAYPNLINALDELMTTQIETCDYLRNLEVDRSQERPKQVLEAKHILQQKRKALSDFFKTLASLGLSYKSGLLEVSLRSEFEDLALPPFCVKTMLGGFKDKKIHPNIVHLNENLDRYYAKCVFKLKLLQNIMLAPLSELGPPNIDRIKGFAVETFLLVQNQRTLLSKSTRNVYELRSIICNLKLLSEMNTLDQNGLKFSKWRDEFVALKESICRVRLLMEQFVLLLKCVPEKESSENTLLVNTNTILVQGEQKFSAITEMCQKLLGHVRSVLSDMAKNDVEFLSFDKMDSFNKAYTDIRFQIEAIRGLLSVSADEYLPAAKSLSELLIHMEQVNKTLQRQEDPSEEPSSFENVDNELENIVHSILLSLQKLFKKYPKQTIITEDGKGQRVSPSKKLAEDEQIQENHLKGKLYQELLADWEILNLSQVTQKMSNILLSIKHSKGAGIQFVRKITSVLPILEQYNLVADYYLFQQLGAHKVSAKMLSVMLTVFVELSTKGFCVPADLMQDEEGESKKNDDKKGEGFGLEDGTGDKDASDKIESEDQLDDAKRPEDRKDEDKKNNEDCKEEKGIDVSDDFEGKMQDIEKPEEEDDSGQSEDEEDLNKEMGDTDKGADKLDDQIWGSDEEQEQSEEENEMEEEDEGKGSKDESDAHNDLDSKNESKKGEDEHDKDGLDATEDPVQDKEKKKQEKDIDEMKEPEFDEEQVNPYHNQLEDPPEAEEMDLGDNVNVDDERDADDQQQDENPFDIDTMKDLKQPEKEKEQEDEEGEGDGDKDEPGDEDKNEGDSSDSEEEPEAGKDELKKDKGAEDANDENKEEENVDKEDPETKSRGELDEEEQKQQEEDENKESKTEDQDTEAAEESKDKQSKEENVQSVPETENKGSTDQVQSEDLEKDINQDQKLDEQDTGEDKDGVGQAENETSDQGHQGIAETKETEAKSEQSREKPKPEEKRKQGQTNEERTLGEAEKNKLKQLKTIDKLKEQKENAEEKGENDEKENEAETEEFQHVKDPKTSDKITLDNATEEQSKQIKHLEDEDKNNDDEEKGDEENTDELMDVDETPNHEEMEQDNEEVSAEKLDNKSDKPSKTEKKKEQSENTESVEVEGDAVETMTVSRGDDTTAHCIKEILMDTSVPQDLTAAETLELRKAYQNQLVSGKGNIPQHEDYEMWQIISNKMLPNARELCEQLRLILEPTKCTRLKGDYRTGRRINMKKIIPYIASQFRKDKIWLRRTKPAQRDYKITIAIDDSKSMDHNNSKELTLEAISLVSQALTLLESGRLSIVSFGEAPKIILNHTEQFDGPKLISSLAFSQEKTNIADLLDFVRTVNTEEGSMGSDNGLFENLLLVLSDGRNIFSEGNVKVRNAVKLARRQRIFLVYIIIDNPENKSSILDIQSVEMLPDQKLSIKSYLDDFPFPYYMIVRDLGQLPLVLSEAMRQWFELVNSEQ